jgi:DNA-directed RNA polymerase sigma subunit (sigma70/sigma32)
MKPLQTPYPKNILSDLAGEDASKKLREPGIHEKLEAALFSALSSEEFRVVMARYKEHKAVPQIVKETGFSAKDIRILTAEALQRLRNPVYGLIESKTEALSEAMMSLLKHT